MGNFDPIQLQPLAERHQIARRARQAPDTDSLTTEQRRVYESVLESLRERNVTVLCGAAGVGKTYTSAVVTEALLWNNSKKLAVVAPTHKALGVISSKIPFRSNRMAFYTLHSILGLRMKFDSEIPYCVPHGEPRVADYDFIVCDESSMVAPELFGMLLEYRKPILFVGDDAQLKPVESPVMPVFDQVQNIYRLETVMRQAAGNPIIEYATAVREAQKVLYPDEFVWKWNQKGEGVCMLNSAVVDDREYANELLETYFVSENFREDDTFAVVLCAKRSTVQQTNKHIRFLIYGSHIDKLMPGERMIANASVVGEEDEIILATNQTFKVLSADVEQMDVSGHERLFVYRAHIETETGKQETITIIHEESEGRLKTILKDMAAIARAASGYDRKLAWQSFHAFKAMFADVDYAYSLTIHKSQGSTYKNVFLQANDMRYTRFSADDKTRLLYTGLTRASSRAFITI